jgi:GNAT superfamily N-acetyltransferase
MPFDQLLDNGFRLRTIRDEADIERYVAFNSIYNNKYEGLNTNILLRHFPGSSFDDFQFIEDPSTGQIVATTCLIPWKLKFSGVLMRGAQLEQVLSHPDYRRHGLIKILIRRFMQTVAEQKFDFSFIWGIPYYYRQYGYSYAIEGNVFETLPVERISDKGHDRAQYTVRQATLLDAALLTQLYCAAMESLDFHITRGQDHWRYLIEHAKLTPYIVTDLRKGEPAGYFAISSAADPSGLQVIESGISAESAGWAILRHLKSQTNGVLRIAWPRGAGLTALARSLGSQADTPSQWLFHLHDPAAFMSKLKPAFEHRLANSNHAGMTCELVVNLFRQAYRLNFHAGKLNSVDSLGFVNAAMGADGGDLCIPPDAFIRLVFGFRDLDQLVDAWPDTVVKNNVRPFISTLFPTFNSYLYATYAFFGDHSPAI